MGLQLCDGSGPFNFRNSCIRESWSAAVPAVLVILFCVASIPLPSPVRRVLDVFKGPFKEFITLEEAERMQASSKAAASVSPEEDAAAEELESGQQDFPTIWSNLVLPSIAFLEVFAWTGFSIRQFLISSADQLSTESRIWSIVIAITWLYAAIRCISRPIVTAPPDLFWLFFVHLISAILLLGGLYYEYYVFATPLPPTPVIITLAFHLITVIVALTVVFRLPIAVPSATVKKSEIGVSITPEDYTSLWGWVTYWWVHPLITLGSSKTLEESDVWSLSPTMQSAFLLTKFMEPKKISLLRRIVMANLSDAIKQFFFNMMSVILNYAGPFFLKLILDSIDDPAPTRDSRARAYVYAFLAFLCSILKAEGDLHHYFHGRRAATRLRSEVMAAIYDKALKRKDLSAATKGSDEAASEKKDDKGKAKDKKPSDGKKGDKADKDKKDDPKSGADLGKITNLMSADASQLGDIASGIYSLYEAPAELVVCVIFLYQLLGVAAFVGIGCALLNMPLNKYAASTGVRIRKELSTARDKRTTVVSELINSIKFVKFFAWEEKWIKKAMDARQVEIYWIIRARMNNLILSLVWWSAPVIVAVASFATYVSLGHELTVGTAFTALALFNMLSGPLNVIPFWIVQLMQAKVALQRIAIFLEEDEVDGQVSCLKPSLETPVEAEGLGIEHGSFVWNTGHDSKPEQKDSNGKAPSEADTVVETDSADGESGDHKFELKDINVKFPEGQLTLVTGPTASGKTALLMALLGEMTALPGSRLIMLKDPTRVDENGYAHTISYAAQSPWLRHQTIKENILFDTPYDEERYKAVVECCALKPDFDVLEDGDSTEIGAGGLNLSGGQKARVALARAVYARTKFVLLDDPLSAVDSHTARFLFDRLLCGPLLANRTVILVTHHVELVIPGAHYLIRMLDGRIDVQGTMAELREQGVLEELKHDSAVEIHDIEASSSPTEDKTPEDGETNGKTADKKPAKFIQDEQRAVGGVKWSIYNTYLKASSYWVWIGLPMLLLLREGCQLGLKLWIRTWGEAYDEQSLPQPAFSFASSVQSEDEYILTRSFSSNFFYSTTGSISTWNLPNPREHPMYYVGIYAAIGSTMVVVQLSSNLLMFTGAIRASRRLFSGILVKVVRATMRWHDTTPHGRILNRFGKDMVTIDNALAHQLSMLNTAIAMFLTACGTILIFFPIFLLPAAFIACAYAYLAIGYLKTGRDLRRMEANSRSPIFSGFSELLDGIVTVRAFSAEKRFLETFHTKMDGTTCMWYNYFQTNRWLLLNFDILGGVSIFITSTVALYSLAGSGLAGICITSAMSFSEAVYFGCRLWTMTEMSLNAVERVVEYMEVPQEPPAVIESNRPPAYWPSSSNKDAIIQVEDLVVKYAPDLPPVLHGISFSLKAQERVGILGRTGSGKSTLAMSILRFVDPAGGRIVIDGIDISTIGLDDLRSRLTFIPQDATLFSGTIRDNLDPFDEHDDSECLDALYRVQMISANSYDSQRPSQQTSRAGSIHEGETDVEDSSSVSRTIADSDTKTVITLDTKVSARGSNFSQGQRQLLALARALLRRSSIVLLDEATSSIDFATDAKIQNTIREEFNDSLLLTVAHRLQTIIDYDRLLVLDKGQIAEFDTPFNLINKEGGIFRSMCMNSGMFSELEASAQAHADRS